MSACTAFFFVSMNFKYKRLFKKTSSFQKKGKSGFKKSYFSFSKEHQNYINFDKKHHNADSNFLYSKFVTYINVIPYSRAPFFLALYLGTIVPQMLFIFRRIKKDGESLNWIKGIVFTTAAMALLNLFYWFFDLFIETNSIGKHNQKIYASMSYGFTIFMLSEICIFGGLFWGFFDRAFHPSVVLQSVYMPSGTHGLPSLELVFRGSFLLSLSCSAFNAMKRCLMCGENNRARFWGFISMLIGLTFLFQQVEEYQSLPYMMSVNAHCSFFYAITGLHGFHVAIGIMLIGTIIDRIEQEKFNQYELVSVTFAEIYWYFVDLVWFFLLFALYAYGIYHPNCVLYDKYTIIDRVKDFIFTLHYYICIHLEDSFVVTKDFKLSSFEKLIVVFKPFFYQMQYFISYLFFSIEHFPDWWICTKDFFSNGILYIFRSNHTSFFYSYFHMILFDTEQFFYFFFESLGSCIAAVHFHYKEADIFYQLYNVFMKKV